MKNELIIQYLLNQLSIDEKARFEQKMNSDPVLKKEVDITKLAVEASDELGKSKLKSSLQNMHAELYNQPKKRKTNKTLFILLLLFLIGAITWWGLQKNDTSIPVQDSSELFAQYYKPIDFSNSLRSDKENPLSEIKQLYDQKKYNKVIEAADEILNNQELQASNLLMLKAISYIELNKTKNAIRSLEKIINNNDFNYIDQANWYLGMIYLKNADEEKGLTYLEQLAKNPNADHHLEALQIIKAVQGE